MFPELESRIHGIRTRWADSGDGGVEVSYAYPGPLQQRGGPPRADAGKERTLVLGVFTADPDSQDLREEQYWRWAPGIEHATRVWARHVLAAEATAQSMMYRHEDELVLVWAQIPAIERELELLSGGFMPAMATWRAPYTAETMSLALRSMQAHARARPTSASGTAPDPQRDASEHDARTRHAWMRWAAGADTRVLRLGGRIYRFQHPPEQDGSRLILQYRLAGTLLRLTFDVARHPVVYDVTVAVGEHEDRLIEYAVPAVGWANFEALIGEIQRLTSAEVPPALAKPTIAAPAAPLDATKTATAPAKVTAPISGEQMDGPHRRADVWETVLASVLAGFELPETLPLYPLAQRLTRAALAVVDEQVALHGDDYLDSLRRRDATQVARLAQLEKRLYGALAEAESFGGLGEVVRHVLGLADGSIRRPPAGTASEAFFRTWAAPESLTIRGLTLTLRRHQVVFEQRAVELRYSAPTPPGASTPTLHLHIGLPDKHRLCEVRAWLWNHGAAAQAQPWKLTVPQLQKLTGTSIVRQLRPIAPTAVESVEQDAWEDMLVTEYRAQDARDPQLRLERRLGSGSRIFVAFIPGSRPEQIVARIDINADLEIESLAVARESADIEPSLRRRLEAALDVTRARHIGEDEAEDYAAARTKALREPPRAALVDRLAQHLASEREAAAMRALRAEARTDLGAAARTVAAMASPAGPTPSETVEWLDDLGLPRSAALLSSYIFAPAVALDTFLVDLSESLDQELGIRPVVVTKDGALKVPRDTLRKDGARTYVLEAAGTSIRPHTVTVTSSNDSSAYIDPTKLVKGALRSGEARLYADARFSEDTITEVRQRYHGLMESLLQAPVQIDDLRQLIVAAAELVDAPRCQGTARANAQHALESARHHYADARTQLQRGRDARALDRLREVLRAVVQVAHNSAESCAAGQTALLDFEATPANM